MVSRLEIFLVLALVFLSLTALLSERKAIEASKKAGGDRRNVEVRKGTLREVNATNVLNRYRSELAYQSKGSWHFQKLIVYNPEIRSLRSERAMKKGALITMEGNVSMEKLDGSRYYADRVLFDNKKKTIRSVGPFRGEKNGSYVRGVDFYHNLKTDISKGKRVFGHYKMQRDRNASKPKL